MLFNDALRRAAEIALRHLADPVRPVVLVRDLFGKIRVVLPADAEPRAEALGRELSEALGPYAYESGSTFLRESDLRDAATDAREVLRDDRGAQVQVVDRLLIGTEWSAHPSDEAQHPKRFTLYSMKGGVGRSTTAVVLARHLAQQGKRVLIFDLDLESPGIGATLLGEALPAFGIVDWFVEDVLGQGEQLLERMVRESTLSAGPGTILVVPAYGADTGDYLAKLGRAYLERGPDGRESWPSRVKRLVRALEAQVQPDVVLLDSRTGLHDTSAALVLAMGANTLMFAVDAPQTWRDYRFLFEHWTGHPDLAAFYDKLWMVGAMVPETDRREYLDGASDRSWSLFAETLYGAPQVSAIPGFTMPVAEDESARHYPRPIFWSRALMAFDPLASWTQESVSASYSLFLKWFDRTLLGEPEEADFT